MRRMVNILGLALLVAAALTVALPTPAQAQYVIVQGGPVVAPAPVVTYYGAPSISYAAPVVTYASPRVSYYAAPTYVTPAVSYYSAPAVSYYSAPVVTTYSQYVPAAPVVTAAPGLYSTYTYRNGLGIFRPRYVTQTYYTPLR